MASGLINNTPEAVEYSHSPEASECEYNSIPP
jgi:hypothetical protein